MKGNEQIEIRSASIEVIAIKAVIPPDQYDFSWPELKRVRFIESLLVGIPTPAFWFDARTGDSEQWLVLDGVQRVLTLKYFLNGDLKLQGLEFLKEFEGSYYLGLVRTLRRRLHEAETRVNLFKPRTSQAFLEKVMSRIKS